MGAVSATTPDYPLKFRRLIDDVLNAAFFVLIGIEVLTIPSNSRPVILGLAISLVLLARALSAGGPHVAARPLFSLGRLAQPALIRGGLRGGISLALALGPPERLARSVVLAATDIVVLFSVIPQKGSIARLLEWLAGRTDAAGAA